MGAMGGGKRTDPNAVVAELRATVARLEQVIQKIPEEQKSAAQLEEKAKLSAAIKAREPAVIAMASDATKYPAIANKMGVLAWQRGILNDVTKLRTEARDAGRPLDLHGALSRINAALARVEGSPAGATPAATASATPASPVAAKATSIAPSQARSMPVVRDKTQEERDRDLANDTDYLASIGLA
jgi:hypothetical protein